MFHVNQQVWNSRQYAEHARFVSDLGAPLIEMLAPKPCERVLELGCGDGVPTEQLMRMDCEVVGVGASPAMIEGSWR
ncbi:MAG: class I SAM-dependent methyltransferase [Nitrospiraceae bacterium]